MHEIIIKGRWPCCRSISSEGDSRHTGYFSLIFYSQMYHSYPPFSASTDALITFAAKNVTSSWPTYGVATIAHANVTHVTQFDLCSFDHLKFTKECLKSPKMVRFGRFKRLEPLKRGCPITCNGYLGDRTVRNAWFCSQTPFKTVAMATDTLKGNLTCIPYHLIWVSVWSVPYPGRR